MTQTTLSKHPLHHLLEQDDYEAWELNITNFIIDKESQKHQACSFTINTEPVIYRHAHSTPKKAGQFVTFWKRNLQGETCPFCETDLLNYFLIVVKKKEEIGCFIFPKSVLIEKNIISSSKTTGKRGFRIYPPWDITTSKQAKKTQDWQLTYFVKSINKKMIHHFLKLYQQI